MQPASTIGYGEIRTVMMPFDEAVMKLEAALKNEGFGVLCRIDIQAKMKEKLNIEFPRYLILGACNPQLAHHALEADINIGLLLPCNAIIYELQHEVRVGIIDAEEMLSVAHRPDLAGLAGKAHQKLLRALNEVASSH